MVLIIQLEYAIIGTLELENSQSIICLSCRSICSILLHNDKFKWLSLVVYPSPSLRNPHTAKCTHSPQTNENKQQLSSSQHQIVKSINQTFLSFEKAPFDYGSQTDLPGLYSEPAAEQYLDDMEECPRVPPDINIETFPLDVDQDFQHLCAQLRQQLSNYKSLHPLHKNDVGTFPTYQAVLTPSPDAKFIQEAPRRHDAAKVKVGLDIEQDLLNIGVIEPSEYQFPCNALLTVKAEPFMIGSNTKADKYISKTTHVFRRGSGDMR